MEAQSPSGSSSTAYPRWVMFEQYLEIKVEDSTCSPTDDAKTLAAARTSVGHPIQVSLRLVEPPSLSRVCLRIPDGVKVEKSRVLAAHGDSVLIQVRIKENYLQYYTAEHFVYNAGAAAADPPRPPSLSLLPPYYERICLSGSDVAPRELFDGATGLLRRAKDELVVAELSDLLRGSLTTPRVAKLYLFRSGEWNCHHFKIREDWELPFLGWHTVVPIDDQLLCWVNKSGGVLLCHVFEETPWVQHLRLPMDPRKGWSNRNVCATAECGVLKFINIFGRCCCGVAASCDCEHSCHAYTIHTWTMRIDDDNMEWVKDGIVDATELWALDAYKGLPCDALDRPFVSLDEPDLICFRLRDTKYGSQTLWQIMVNMRSKTIHSVSCHEREVGYCYSLDKLIPSSVSYFFNTLTGQIQMGDERPPAVVVDEQLIKKDDQSCNPALQPSLFTETASVQTFSEMFEALQEIPSFGFGSDELKAYRILISSDDNGRQLKSLSRLPKDLRKDWLLMEIKASDAY